MYIMVYFTATDSDALIKTFKDKKEIKEFVEYRNLTRYDYAIFKGTVEKTFDGR